MFLSVRFRVCFFMLLVGMAVIALVSGGAAAQGSRVLVFPVQGIIGPATSDYIIKGLKQASNNETQLVIIELDTPGGLDPSMRAIVQAILASPVPVATFVSPGGARAASAGTFILYASHIAAMTPASNLGAASPVSIGIGGASDPDQGSGRSSRQSRDADVSQPEDSDDRADSQNGNSTSEQQRNSSEQGDTAKSAPSAGRSQDNQRKASSDDVMAGKVTSDAAAYIRSLAQLRDRDVEFAEQAVLDAKSLSASEALEQGVIDYIARDVTALLQQLDGREIVMSESTTVTLNTTTATVQYQEPGWRTKVLSIITNPQLALVLMMIGIYGLFFELTSPGFALPGVAGMICLVLGLYAFHMLPINWAGVALIFVGTALMIAEIFFPSAGVLGVGGAIAFVLGGLFLTDTGIPEYDLSIPFLIGIAVASGLLTMLTGTLVAQSHKKQVVTGSEAMLDLEGVITRIDNGILYAQIRGEQWQVRAEEPLQPGDRVRVNAVQDLTLHVVRVSPPSTHVV